MYTFAPFTAKAWVAINPMPEPPPEMTTTLSLTLNKFSSLKSLLLVGEDMVGVVEKDL